MSGFEPTKKIAALETARLEAERCLRKLPFSTDEDRRFYVYVLLRDDQPRYVGKGTGSRIDSHAWYGADHYNERLAVDFAKGELQSVKVIEELTDQEALAVEMRLIALWGLEADGRGGLLANLTYGGESGVLAEEACEKISDANRKNWNDPDVRTKRAVGISKAYDDDRKKVISARNRKSWEDPKFRENFTKERKALWADQNKRSEQSKRVKEAKASVSDEEKALRSKKNSKSWQNPETKAKRIAGIAKVWNDPEYKARTGAAISAALAKPEEMARRKAATTAAMADPEKKARQKAGVRAAWADPVKSAERRVKMRAAWDRKKALKDAAKSKD